MGLFKFTLETFPVISILCTNLAVLFQIGLYRGID